MILKLLWQVGWFDFDVHQRIMCHVTPQTLPSGASLFQVNLSRVFFFFVGSILSSLSAVKWWMKTCGENVPHLHHHIRHRQSVLANWSCFHCDLFWRSSHVWGNDKWSKSRSRKQSLHRTTWGKSQGCQRHRLPSFAGDTVHVRHRSLLGSSTPLRPLSSPFEISGLQCQGLCCKKSWQTLGCFCGPGEVPHCCGTSGTEMQGSPRSPDIVARLMFPLWLPLARCTAVRQVSLLLQD